MPVSALEHLSGFRHRGDKSDRSLARANELNLFFNRFSSGGSTASSSLAPSRTDLTPSLDPQLPSHTYAISSCTSLLSPTTSGNTETPLASMSLLSVSSIQVEERKSSWRDWIGTRLQVQTSSVLGSWRPASTSYVRFCSTCLISIWARQGKGLGLWKASYLFFWYLSSIWPWRL